MKRLLGIDYGAKRVGLAITDEDGTLAFPLVVLRNTSRLVEEVKEICEEEGIGGIVLGESRNFAGEENPVQEKIGAFKKKLEKAVGLPIRYEPEFMTSAQAGRVQGEREMRDASAAAIILQSSIDKGNRK